MPNFFSSRSESDCKKNRNVSFFSSKRSYGHLESSLINFAGKTCVKSPFFFHWISTYDKKKKFFRKYSYRHLDCKFYNPEERTFRQEFHNFLLKVTEHPKIFVFFSEKRTDNSSNEFFGRVEFSSEIHALNFLIKDS